MWRKNHKVLTQCKMNTNLGKCKPETDEEQAQSQLGKTNQKVTRLVLVPWMLSLGLISVRILCSSSGEVSFLMDSGNTASLGHFLIC